MSKEHAMLLSVFLLFKFLSKDLIIAAIAAYFIRGIVALSATLPPIKCFLTEECNYEEVVSRTPLIHTVSVDSIKSRVVVSIAGFFFCMWCAAKKHCLANNVLGISSPIQEIEMPSLASFKTGAILLAGLLMHDIFWLVFTSVMVRLAESFYAPIKLLFPTADAAWPSSMRTIGDTGIPGIFVALALCIGVRRGSKNCFFNYTFLRCTVCVTIVIIVMNWFQATQGGQPALLYIAHGLVGLVAVHCLWNEVKQDGINQLMGKVWDWNNIYVTKLKKFDGWFLHTSNKDGDKGDDDATAFLEDCEDGPEDGYSATDGVADSLEDHDGGEDSHGAASEDSDVEIVPCDARVVQVLASYEDGNEGDDDATALPEDCGIDGPEDGYSGVDDVAAPLEDQDGGQDSRGAAAEDSDDDIVPGGPRAVQVLAIRANFPISTINGYDGRLGRCIYTQQAGEVQEEGMVYLVPIGPSDIFMAYGPFVLEVFYYTPTADSEGYCRAPPIQEGWDTNFDYEPKEYTQTICPDPGRKLEITYLVIPTAVEANVEVRVKLKDLGSRSRAMYGKIRASATGYGNKSVYLFSCERVRSRSFPSGSILPLRPSVIAMPYCRHLELHIEVGLTVITTCDSHDSQEMEVKNLNFDLKFTRRIRSQEREVDGDQLEVNIDWDFYDLRRVRVP